MARQRKSLETQIRNLDEQINKLQEKLDSLVQQKKELLNKKRDEELKELYRQIFIPITENLEGSGGLL